MVINILYQGWLVHQGFPNFSWFQCLCKSGRSPSLLIKFLSVKSMKFRPKIVMTSTNMGSSTWWETIGNYDLINIEEIAKSLISRNQGSRTIERHDQWINLDIEWSNGNIALIGGRKVIGGTMWWTFGVEITSWCGQMLSNDVTSRKNLTWMEVACWQDLMVRDKIDQWSQWW